MGNSGAGWLIFILLSKKKSVVCLLQVRTEESTRFPPR